MKDGREAYLAKYGLSGHLTEYEIRQEMERRRYQWLRQNLRKGFYEGAGEQSQIAGTAIPLEEHHRQVRAERGMFDPQTGELDIETPVMVYDVEKHARQVDGMLIRMDGTRCNYPPCSYVRSTRAKRWNN